MLYLSRSDVPDFSLINTVLSNFLGLTAGVGIIIAAIYIATSKRSLIMPLLYIALSPIQNYILMSKLGAIVDSTIFLLTFFLFSHYSKKINNINHYSQFKRKFFITLSTGILAISLIVGISFIQS
jgi:hypothetical protein